MTNIVEIMALAIIRDDLAAYEQADPGYIATALLDPEKMEGYRSLATAAQRALHDAGYAIVPVDPTEAMLEAANNADRGMMPWSSPARAMINAGKGE